MILLGWKHLRNLFLKVSVATENILPTIEIHVRKEDTEGKPNQSLRPKTSRNRFIEELNFLSTRHIQTAWLIRKVPYAHHQAIIVSHVGTIHTHRPGRNPFSIESNTRSNTRFCKSSILLIEEQEVLDRIVGYRNIQPSIPICIENRKPKGLAGWYPRIDVSNLNA